MAEKAVRDASYYITDLNQTQENAAAQETAPTIKEILIRCGSIRSDFKGIAVDQEGFFRGYEGDTPLQTLDTKKLQILRKNIVDAEILFTLADDAFQENKNFEFNRNGADYCELEYLNGNAYYSATWAKHPYLREMDPPPQKLITLFESVQNAAQGKAPEKLQPVIKKETEEAPALQKQSDSSL